MTIRNNFISASSSRAARAIPIQQAWAAYVRNRWPTSTLCEIQCEWALTEGEARNLLYAHGSLKAIQKALDHRNGGLRLEIDMALFRWSTTLTEYADQREKERARARLNRESQEESERLSLSRLASADDQAGSLNQAVAAQPGGAP